MINIEIFLIGLFAASTATSLVTEAIKLILEEHNISYFSNTLVGIVTLFLSGSIGAGYAVFNHIPFTSENIASIISYIFLSWLCSMVGYDKVIQAITQFRSNK